MKTTLKEINIKNRRATFDYYIEETMTAGIVLTGTEIKSIRLGKASLVDTYCYIVNGEVWVKEMYIAPYFTALTIIPAIVEIVSYCLRTARYNGSKKPTRRPVLQ